MRLPETLPPWWDREIDNESGQVLRADVRESAHRVWGSVCSHTQRVLGDAVDAPELLESTVKSISRYLDRHNVPPFSTQLDGLLYVAYRRSLARLARQRKRLEPVGGIHEMAELLSAPDWSGEVEKRLLLEEIACELGNTFRAILRIRISGYGWKEIGRIVGLTPATVRKSFWRELRKAYLRLFSRRDSKLNTRQR